MANYEALYNEIKASDRAMAPGSETTAWGEFLQRMQACGIQDVFCTDTEGQQIPDDEAEWWQEAYQRMMNGQDWDAVKMEIECFGEDEDEIEARHMEEWDYYNGSYNSGEPV